MRNVYKNIAFGNAYVLYSLVHNGVLYQVKLLKLKRLNIAVEACTGWPKIVSHCKESSVNRIKNRHYGYIFHQF